MAILSMTPQDDLDLTAYLHELLRIKKPEQQNKNIWFPTPENHGKPEDHTPKRTGILKELIELKKKNSIRALNGRLLPAFFRSVYNFKHSIYVEYFSNFTLYTFTLLKIKSI